MNFYIKLADRVIQIESIYDYIFSQCADYVVSDDLPDITITIEDVDLTYERNKAMYTAKSTGEAVGNTRPSYLESLAVYRKISEQMLAYNTFLMHGSVLSRGDGAVMITAASGTGKTTVTRRQLSLYEDAFVINGDKPLIRYDENSGKCMVHGTPWAGKERMNRNTSDVLKKVIILRRGEEEGLKKLLPLQAFPTLLQQTYRPLDSEKMKVTIQLLSHMIEKVEIWQYTLPYQDSVRELTVLPLL